MRVVLDPHTQCSGFHGAGTFVMDFRFASGTQVAMGH
jgi:hypothetical protein